MDYPLVGASLQIPLPYLSPNPGASQKAHEMMTPEMLMTTSIQYLSCSPENRAVIFRSIFHLLSGGWCWKIIRGLFLTPSDLV